jgi:UDP-GlcNAc:undecaprenyl-phosphate GlcNAc-1-phosphate transferase
MEYGILSICIATFVMVLCSVAWLRPIAVNIGLVDKPNTRKKHSGDVPLIGGVSIYISILMVTKLSGLDSSSLSLYLFSCFCIVILGALDDYMDIKPVIRLCAQFIIASLLVFGADMYISSLGELLPGTIVALGYWGIPFTLLAVPAAINAFNMVDGIDGLVGCLSIVTFSALGLLFFWTHNILLFKVSLTIVAALFAFLLFNLGGLRQSVGKIFMGDSGSMMLGLSVVWLLVLGTQLDNPAFNPITAVWLIALPLMDMIRVMIRRLQRGQSLFQPDRDHIHHILLLAGYSSKHTLFVITSMAIVLSLAGVSGELFNISENVMLLAFLFVFGIYFIACQLISKRIKLAPLSSSTNL